VRIAADIFIGHEVNEAHTIPRASTEKDSKELGGTNVEAQTFCS
jgi:hypothetical protein